MNIPMRFHEWRKLLSEYREVVDSCPLPRISRDGSRMVQNLMICLLDRRSVLLNPFDVKSSCVSVEEEAKALFY